MRSRILLKNGHIVTMAQEDTRVDSLCIEDGKITALGSFSDLAGLVESGVEVLDLNGMAVLPGFIDCHVHLIMTAICKQQLELRDARSFDEIFEKIRLWDKEHPEDEWICGWMIDDTALKEGRMPEAKDLDKANVKKPVWVLRLDGNTSAVNSLGLRKLTFSLDDFSVIKDGSGNPTGLFKVPSNFAVRLQMLNRVGPEHRRKGLREVASFALSRGITTVHAMEYLDDIVGYEETFASLPIRVEKYARSDDLDRVLKLGLKTLAGDILLDGMLESHTAAISAPYTDNPKETGILYYENKREFLFELMKKARREGLQSAFHAVGDRGIQMCLDILEAVYGDEPPIRHRIEHYVLPSPNDIRRTAKLGVYASIDPTAIWSCLEGGSYFNRLGPERVKRAVPFRELFDEGIVVGANSDTPIKDMNPLLGIDFAVNAPYESQRLKLREALEMVTINGAKLAFKEDDIGSIEVGKYADLAVLKENPFDVSQDRIKDIEIVMTFVDGEMQYKK